MTKRPMLLTLYGWQFRKTFDILGHSLIKNVLARRSESPVPSLPLLTMIVKIQPLEVP